MTIRGEEGRLPYVDASGRATLRTVAELAGVHVSTVSRVLNGSTGTGVRTAGASTTERIRRIALEVGYQPNPHATGLRTRRSQLIGVLVPRLVDIVLATIYEGVEEAAASFGFSAFVANTGDDPVAQRLRTQMVLARRVDAMIFGDAYIDGTFLDDVAHQGVPFVLVSRRASHHPSVTCDDYEGGRLAAQHLLELGHRNVAVIAGEPYASTGIDRTAGFVDTFAEAGITIARSKVVHSHFDTPGGRDAMQQILASRRRPTAVFATNDFAAIGAMGALREAGLQVGTDVAVVGYNDVPLAGSLPVPLTTVRSPMHDMGVKAVHLLMKRLGGEEVESERLTPLLVVRESSQPNP
ncbi:LacI family DNA-binding transcriptional regulator [Angustibacter sp. Root456]|uniref:LacI family DNA-binding transcriptional regulator n=1 Tax=Angustibacter sp. Root456 TaxID=1736539 RepID=UPI0006FDE127|nr:substrate-binding domain-containing protein [Angustibacter sp. Root456]KQX66131.1 LacI family transcriptional regulator [Angustibacter sp. Root456]